MKRSEFRIFCMGMVIAFWALAASANYAYCDTIIVKSDGTGDYATIQDAIDNATAGDEVVLQPGNYTGDGNRDISFGGKAITVRGSDPDNWTIVEATIIDCQGSYSDPHRGFYFHDNETDASVLTGVTITNGWEHDGAGVLCYENSNPSITKCAINDNNAHGGNGGGVYCWGASPTISNCEICTNLAEWGAGVACYDNSNPTITNSQISANQASYGYGGGVSCSDNSSPTITDCIISGNQASDGGGVLCYWQSSPTITDCIISGNQARDGGGVYCDDSSPTISNCTITGNQASDDGGGVFCSESSPTVTNCTISGNRSRGGGGMFSVWFSNPVLTNCMFSGNCADFGGGMFNEDGTSPEVTNCIFSGNLATYVGGGMYNGLSKPVLTNCTFSQNRALLPMSGPYGGGGMFNQHSELTLTNCIFNSNSADAEGTHGGGMYNIAGRTTLTNCAFIHNSSAGLGGGMANMPGDWGGKGNATLTNCIFSGNYAKSCGAISNEDCSMTLTNCTFGGNLASNEIGGIRMGGIYAPPELITLTNCILWANSDAGGVDESAQINIEFGLSLVNYSCIQGWTGSLGGLGNIDTDPLFADPGHWDDNGTGDNESDDFWVDGDYHLKSRAWRWEPAGQIWTWDNVTSRCIDAGNPGCDPGDEWPFEGNRINMGASGGTDQASVPPHNWASIADINNDRIVDWGDFDIFASYWLAEGECIPADLDRSKIVNWGDFSIFAAHWLEGI